MTQEAEEGGSSEKENKEAPAHLKEERRLRFVFWRREILYRQKYYKVVF
jgi:hypothetical protein